MINDFWTAWWLFGGVLEGLIFFWPVSLLLSIHLIAAVARSVGSIKSFRNLMTLIVPFVWPCLILFIGAAWRSAGQINEAALIPILGVTTLFLIQLVLSAGIIYLRSEGRWAAVATSMLAGWFGVLSLFVAKVALTNAGL